MPSKSSAKKTASGAKPASSPAHQTHGGYTPITGPISSVRQLVRGPNVAKGSIGSFPSQESYGKYLRGLTDTELHRHAIEEAHIVAIDDRERLIRRLEGEWSAHAMREPGNPLASQVPKRAAFTDEQVAKQEAIRKQLLGRLA